MCCNLFSLFSNGFPISAAACNIDATHGAGSLERSPDDAPIIDPTRQRFEISHTIRAKPNDLSIKDGGVFKRNASPTISGYRFDQSAPFIVYVPIADMDLQSIAIVLQLVCPITQREAAWR